MDKFTRAHNRWLDPPEEPPVCEDGCGETLVPDLSGDWYCNNIFCPTKFDGTEKKMAEALVDALEEIRTLKRGLAILRRKPS